MTTTTKTKLGRPYKHHKKFERIKNLLHKGWSTRLIAQKIKVSKSLVWLIKKEQGIKAKPTRRLITFPKK